MHPFDGQGVLLNMSFNVSISIPNLTLRDEKCVSELFDNLMSLLVRFPSTKLLQAVDTRHIKKSSLKVSVKDIAVFDNQLVLVQKSVIDNQLILARKVSRVIIK